MKKRILAPLSIALMIGGGLTSLQAADSAGISGTVTTLGGHVFKHGYDSDGDGKSDLILRRNGTVYFWGMNGKSVIHQGSISTGLSADWKVAKSGDFDGDGKSDLILRHNNGTVYFWGMNGKSVVHQGTVSRLNSAWKIKE
jgi:hypothetical protein